MSKTVRWTNYEQSLFISFTSHRVRSSKLTGTEGEGTGFTGHRGDCASGTEAPLSQGRQIMSKSHPGFSKVASGIAKRQGVSKERASAMLAAGTRKAGAAAKRANPKLKKVKGY